MSIYDAVADLGEICVVLAVHCDANRATTRAYRLFRDRT